MRGRPRKTQMQPDGTLGKPANDTERDASQDGPPAFYALMRQGERHGVERIKKHRKVKAGPNRGKWMEEGDEDFYKRLRWRAWHGDFKAGENPIDMLLGCGKISEDMARQAHRLRLLWVKQYGPPEASTSSYGRYGDQRSVTAEEAKEYDHKRRILEALGRHTMGHVFNVAVFRREPTDISTIQNGLGALVAQWVGCR